MTEQKKDDPRAERLAGSRKETTVPQDYHKPKESATPAGWTHLAGSKVNPEEVINYGTPEPEAPPPINAERARQLDDTLLEAPKLADPDALYDADREVDLIGQVLVGGKEAYQEADMSPGDFYITRNRWTWEACGSLASEDKPIDPISVADELEKAGHPQDEDERQRLLFLAASTSSGAFAASYAGRLKELAARRHAYADTMAEAQEKARGILNLAQPLPESTTRRKTRYSASEILAIQFPDDEGPLPGIIPIGLTILGSRPKVGKSRLLLQASCAWGVGGKFLDFDMENKRVLYYSLDDPERRLQDRLNRLGLDPSATVTFEREIKPLQLGGIALVEQEANDFDIIIIDTIRRAMPGKDFNRDGALFDDILGQLQNIGQNKHMSIISSLHTRKSFGLDFDPVDDVLGSTGLTASADCVLAIYKQPGKTSALFKGRHKDFGDIDLTLEFDPTTQAWQLIGETGKVVETENEEEILHALRDLGKAKPSTIAKELNKNRGHTSTRMAKLWTNGKLRKELINGETYYYIPEEVEK